jgi:hypothetical protein
VVNRLPKARADHERSEIILDQNPSGKRGSADINIALNNNNNKPETRLLINKPSYL